MVTFHSLLKWFSHSLIAGKVLQIGSKIVNSQIFRLWRVVIVKFHSLLK
jgi:hypothetical protein